MRQLYCDGSLGCYATYINGTGSEDEANTYLLQGFDTEQGVPKITVRAKYEISAGAEFTLYYGDEYKFENKNKTSASARDVRSSKRQRA